MGFFHGRVAEWLGTALQKLLLRFESARDLQLGRWPPKELAMAIPIGRSRRCAFPMTRCMKPPLRLTTVILFSFSILAVAQVPVGQWQDHFQYRSTVAVAQGNDGVYCATSTAVFKFDETTGETTRYTKVNALSDVNIQAMAWSDQQQKLLVGYRNGNVDLLGKNSVLNLPDIKRSNLVGDKGIYAIVVRDQLAYLACGFGVVVMDLVRQEVRDTWIIGPGGSQLRVNGLAFRADSIYAATQQGLYVASQQAPNLADFNSWHKRTDLPMPNGAFTAVVDFSGKLFVNSRPGTAHDTLYYSDGGPWQVFPDVLGEDNNSIAVSQDGARIIIAQQPSVRQYDAQLAIQSYTGDYLGQTLKARYAIDRPQGGVWIATDGNGLLRSNNGFLSVSPNGPANNVSYRMAAAQGQVYITTGGVAGNWDDLFKKDGLHRYKDNTWTTDGPANDPLYATGGNQFAGSLNDILPVLVDPDDGNHAFVGSWDDGLVEFRDGRVATFYDPSNSTLQRTGNSATDDTPTRVGGLAYDSKGNLWVANASCPNPLSVRLKNGNWYSMGSIPPLGTNTLIADMAVDESGNVWVVRPRGNGMLLFSDNGTPTDPGDDKSKALTNFEGQGKLPSMDVYSVAVDLDGQIWVGTNKGIGVFYNGDATFGTDGDAQQILLEQDGNVQILLETEAVTAIAVDGANNKWLGTQSSGVYQVSPDGTQQLAHFTVDNSPLPSNSINCIAIDGVSGSVFIGTDQGTLSYRGGATEGSLSSECATVFPNPVRSTFTGPVAITGLVRGSDVRITDVAGDLVYHTTSNGGQALWPGTDIKGERVASGVYLILVVDPSGSSHCNTKVVVVR